ncbi:MAG: hypothetical protein ACOH2K_07195 [Burkholderiaceae bacterium]
MAFRRKPNAWCFSYPLSEDPRCCPGCHNKLPSLNIVAIDFPAAVLSPVSRHDVIALRQCRNPQKVGRSKRSALRRMNTSDNPLGISFRTNPIMPIPAFTQTCTKPDTAIRHSAAHPYFYIQPFNTFMPSAV